MSSRKILYQVLIVSLLAVLIYGISRLDTGTYAEVSTIGQDVKSFQQLSDRFKTLADSKGAIYAYEILRRAPLPPNTDLHLLGHAVGDELYKQNGIEGIAHCTQEFRNACSHAIVIGALNEFGGEKALGLIKDACEKAPGGTGAYTMCFHGLGHGVFAFYGYDFPQTVSFCGKTGTAEHRDREYVECVGGAVMELMGGGGHDREKWQRSREKYLSGTDPLAPCSTNIIPDRVKDICYTYITPHLFEFDGGNLANPQPKDFVAAFNYCNQIVDTHLRNICFGGIGKEFPVLALSRDIRNVNAATDEELTRMRDMCALSPFEDGVHACNRAVVGSLYWGGENDPRVAIRFCQLEEAESARCFEGLLEEARQYPAIGHTRETFCALLSEVYRETCKKDQPSI